LGRSTGKKHGLGRPQVAVAYGHAHHAEHELRRVPDTQKAPEVNARKQT
jgi:hypothetical protein